MKIQKNNDISFKQRYAIHSADFLEGQTKFNILKGFNGIWRGNSRMFRSGNDADILVVTGDEDIAKFDKDYFAAESGENRDKLVEESIKKAFVFGQEQIDKLKALVDPNFDYKVKVRGKNSELGQRNLDILAYTLYQTDENKIYTPVRVIGETKALHGHERLKDVFVAVKSFEKFIQRRARIKSHKGITIGEVDRREYRLISHYLKDAKGFGTEDAMSLINRAREILHQRPATIEEYSASGKFRIGD